MHHASTFQVDSGRRAEFIFRDLAWGTFFSVIMSRNRFVLLEQGYSADFILDLIKKWLFLVFLMSWAAVGYLSPPSLGDREGSCSMWQTFSIIVYVPYYCLHKLKLKDVLYWHQFRATRGSDLQLGSQKIDGHRVTSLKASRGRECVRGRNVSASSSVFSCCHGYNTSCVPYRQSPSVVAQTQG